MALYALAGQKYRPVMFLLAGVFVVGWDSVFSLIPIVLSIVFGYLSALVSEKAPRKAAGAFLALTVLLNAAALVFFSYSRYYDTDFSGRLTGHPLPFSDYHFIGAGIYTLHSISYSADIFMKKYEREKSFVKTACYIGFFPCLICGPVLRYDRIKEDLAHPVISYDRMADGIRALVYGFAQKLIIASPLLTVWQRISAVKTADLSFASCWFAAAAFSLAMYFDFKAYCDIAKGMGLMAGFSMPDNFSAPFSAGGFNELMKRFCSTLYEWARDYIYRPLCPKNDKENIHLPAMLAATVFGVIWFGIGGRYFVWGLFFLLVLTFEYISRKLLTKVNHVLRSVFMNIIFLGGLPLAAFSAPADALRFIAKMFSFSGLAGDVYALYVVKNYFVLYFIAILFAFAPARLVRTNFNRLNPNIVRIVQPIVQTILLLLSTAFLCAGQPEGFMF